MPIRYFFKQLLLPPGLFIVLILLGWWLRTRSPRLALALFMAGVGGLWAMSAPIVVERAAVLIESEPALPRDQWASLANDTDVIVVLGAGRERDDPAFDGDQPSLLALQRIRYAAQLAKASGLPLLITGGLHYGTPPSEAELMAKVLEKEFGVTVRWKESRSRTTWENAHFTADLLRPEGKRRVVLVTQAWHMARSRWCFEQFGFDVKVAPMGFLSAPVSAPLGGWLPEAKAFWQGNLLLNEAVGRIAYPLAYSGAPWPNSGEMPANK
jgi:uncharacterized SAM-binding protein YcdF (DUF218 family)